VPKIVSQIRFEIRDVYAQAFVQVLPGVQEFHGQVVERSWQGTRPAKPILGDLVLGDMPDTRGKILVGKLGVHLPGEQMERRYLIPGYVLGQMSLKCKFFAPGFVFLEGAAAYFATLHSRASADPAILFELFVVALLRQ